MRRVANHFLAAAAAFSLAACATPEPMTGTPDDEKAVHELGPRYESAWNAGDATALAQLVAEDYTSVEPDGSVITGRAAFESVSKTEFEARKTAPPMSIKITTDLFRFVSSKAAVSGGKWTMTGVPAGAGPDKGSWLALSQKGADGQWRMANALGAAYVAPPPPPPAPAKGKTP